MATSGPIAGCVVGLVALTLCLLIRWRVRHRRWASTPVLDLPLPRSQFNPRVVAVVLSASVLAILSFVVIARVVYAYDENAILWPIGLSLPAFGLVFVLAAEWSMARFAPGRLRIDDGGLHVELCGETVRSFAPPFHLRRWMVLDGLAMTQHLVWDIEQNGVTLSFYYEGGAAVPADRCITDVRGIYLGGAGAEVMKRLVQRAGSVEG